MKLFKNEYVTYCLINHKFRLLEPNKASGRIFQIPGYGTLKTTGYEHGFLFIHKRSNVKEHVHKDNIELYNRISGDYSFQGGICLLNHSHKIEPLGISTIVETFKVDKRIIEGIYNDDIVKEILLNKLELLNKIITLLSNGISIEEINNIIGIDKEIITDIYNTYFLCKLPKIKLKEYNKS